MRRADRAEYDDDRDNRPRRLPKGPPGTLCGSVETDIVQHPRGSGSRTPQTYDPEDCHRDVQTRRLVRDPEAHHPGRDRPVRMWADRPGLTDSGPSGSLSSIPPPVYCPFVTGENGLFNANRLRDKPDTLPFEWYIGVPRTPPPSTRDFPSASF